MSWSSGLGILEHGPHHFVVERGSGLVCLSQLPPPQPFTTHASSRSKISTARSFWRGAWQMRTRPNPSSAVVPLGHPWRAAHSTKSVLWIGSQQHLVGGACGVGGVLGVLRRCQAVLWGPSTPNPALLAWKPHAFKNWPIFLYACCYVVDFPHVAKRAFGSDFL